MSASSLVQLLAEVAEICDQDYRDSVRFEPATSVEVLSVILAAIRDCRAELQMLAHQVETDLMSQAGEKAFDVPGLGRVEIRTAVKRTEWDNEGLTRVLVAMALDERKLDEETGEYEPAWEAVARVLMECARPNWRVTPLRARDIQVDEFCREDFSSYSVQLPPRVNP